MIGGALASAFVAKAVLGLTTTEALIERLKMDRALRWICGLSVWKRVPDTPENVRINASKRSVKLASLPARGGSTWRAVLSGHCCTLRRGGYRQGFCLTLI